MNDPILVVGYLVAVSLTADFVVRSDAGSSVAGRSIGALARALLVRPISVALMMLPAVAVFGLPGLAALVLMALPQRYVTAFRRGAPLGAASEWTPVPAALALADQAVKAAFVGAAWLALREAPATAWLTDNLLDPHPGLVDAIVHWGGLAAIAWSLLVVNTRAGSFVVSLLLPPHAGEGAGVAPAPVGYSVKLGPLSGRIEPDAVRAVHEPDAVGATVGGVERLLVVMLLLARAEVAIGLVVAAKTLARFKQLDERHFAERYLIGTLASITIAVGSALLARYALGL